MTSKRIVSMLLVVMLLVLCVSFSAPSADAAATLMWPVPGHTALSRGWISGSHYGLDIHDSSINGATIVGALLLGVSRKVAAEFTFYLAIPVMFGASLLKLVKYGFAFTGAELALLGAAMIVAFVVSIIVIRFLMDYIRKHDFKVFGWYRIILGVAVLLFFWFR